MGAERVAVRLRISCEDPDVTGKVVQELLRWEDVTVPDSAGADSTDPSVWVFVVQELVSLAGPLVAFLSMRATKSQKPIKVEGGHRFSFVLNPDATDEEKATLVQLLAEYGEFRPE